MTPMEALKLALSKEEQSIDLYRDLSVKHPAIKELLIFLINEEMKHKKLIEQEMSKLSRY